MGRHFGQRPSRLFEISDKVLALDFDLACSQSLLEFDAKLSRIEKHNLLHGIYNNTYTATACAFAGKELPDVYGKINLEDI